ncbi:MAG: flagellar hook-length control protein FliK [Bradyrhizobium sp.]
MKQGATTASDAPDGSAGATNASTPAPATGIVPDLTQRAAIAGRPKAENGALDAAKAEASGNTTPAPAVNATTGPSAAADAGQAPDNSPQVAGAFQPQLQSASAAPAATAQLTVTAATQAAIPLSGLAMEIAASARSGKSRFEIRLDPAELGRIDVRIDVDRNGQVTSHLTVDRPETLSMLRQDAPQLQRALDDAGLTTGNSGLQFSLRDQSSSGQDDGGQNNPSAHRLVVEEDTIPAAVAGRSYGRMLGASGGVDIRV